MNEIREHVIESHRSSVFNWRELVAYKELFYFFTWRDVKVKYKQTILGFLWAILQPILMMTVFTLFFGRMLNIPSHSIPYPIFVFSGLLVWNAFSAGLTSASNSMVNNAAIIKKIYFPRLIIPASAVCVALFDMLMAFVPFGAILIYYQQPVSITAFILWPLAIIATAIATVGPGCWLAALTIKYRDFRYVIPFLVQILFFVSPVIYPVDLLPQETLRYLLVASPMYAAVELFRIPLTHVAPNFLYMTISMASSIVLLLIGLSYFKRTEEFFADLA